MNPDPRIINLAPRLSDFSSRQLVTALMGAWAAGIETDASRVLPGRGATVADLRAPLQHREASTLVSQ